MTSPPEEITVQCPKCGYIYQDWHRPSINLQIDDFDEEYLKQATSSTCPECKYTIPHDVLIIRADGVWKLSEGETDGT